MFGVLVVIFVTFTIVNPSAFTSVGNLQNITETAAPYLVMAVATTFLMIAGGLDLSIGSVLVFANVIEAKVMGAVGGDGTLPVLLWSRGRYRRRRRLGPVQRLLRRPSCEYPRSSRRWARSAPHSERRTC